MTYRLNGELAENIRVALDASGVTITTLAVSTGIAERTLRRRFQGNSDWTTGEIERIANTLGVTVASLVETTHIQR